MSSLRDAIAQRYARLRERIAEAARRAGRDPGEILVVGVTKTFPPATIEAAYEAGLRHFGENRVQELLAKQPEVSHPDIVWHLVGHLQTNKVNKVIGRIHLLQSLDRPELAEALQKRLRDPLDCLVEVNTSGEPSKFGLPPDELPAFLDRLTGLDRLRIRGLMTVGPLTEDRDAIRRAFRKLAELFRREAAAERPQQDFRWLSMGMSADFEIAIEEGANMIRVGTALFGPRPAP
jgi:hypothetical protein